MSQRIVSGGAARSLRHLVADVGADAALQCAASSAGEAWRRSRAMRDPAMAVGALGRGEIGRDRVPEQLVGEAVRVHRARLEDVRLDRPIDERRRRPDARSRGLGQELDREVVDEQRRRV